MKKKSKKLTKPGQMPKSGNYTCINGEWVRTDKKNKPVDSTMRNVKAANQKFEKIDQRLDALTEDMAVAWQRIDELARNFNAATLGAYMDVHPLMKNPNRKRAKK